MTPKQANRGRVAAHLADDPEELARALDELQQTLVTDRQTPEEAWDRLRSRYDEPEAPAWIAGIRKTAGGERGSS